MVFIDGMGILRDVARDTSIYRRIVSSIISFLSKNNTTTLISEEMVSEIGKEVISYLTSGEFVLERKERDDEEIFRTIDVVKYRVGHVHLGRHYFDITPNGIEVYPILPVLTEHKNRRRMISTGDKNLDLMLGGGVYEGSDVIITGKSGVGKTNLCLQILKENDRRGDTGIIYSFEESKRVIEERYADLFNYTPSKLIIKEVTPYGINLGRFYRMFIEDVKMHKPKVVVIDPVNPLQRMAFAINELNRAIGLLYSHLTALGTIFIQTYEVSEATDVFHFTGAGISYFADYLILGRYMEVNGELLKTITVIKNRYGDHERTIRILDMKSGEGLKIGAPLKDYTGIMSGTILQ
jgi:circadian clock protein KaiC